MERKPAGFWKIFSASALGTLLLGLVLIFLLVQVLSLWFSSQATGLSDLFQKDTPPIKNNTILTLDLSDNISDRTYASVSKPYFNINQHTGLQDLTAALNSAKTDSRIKGLVIKGKATSMGMADLEELRAAINDFKSSGKFVYAYSKAYTQRSYYLSSVADSVMMYPTGHMEFKGLSSTISFYKGFLDKFDLEVQVIRGSNNRFKSAVEPFLTTEISEANMRQTQRFLDGLWNVILDDVSESRGLEKSELQMIADSLLIRNAQTAVDHGFIDALMSRDEAEDLLKQKLGLKKKKKVNYATLGNYAKRRDMAWQRAVDKKMANLAVIYASGTIHGGKSDLGSIGDESMLRAIRQADKNPLIRAIVLRVNSPGGDALASDVIWDKLKNVKTDKPLVVSMGNVAASGGYYISCMADKIFADEATITGSIGVFLIVPYTGKLLENELGINYSRVKTAEHADMSFLEMSMSSFTRPLTEKEKGILQGGVDETYNEFLTRVAEGRSTFNSTADVDSIGQGRVWAGQDALDIGLVDTLGGLQDAINYAAGLAKIGNVRIRNYPEYKASGLERIAQLMGGAYMNSSDQTKIPSFILDRLEELGTISDMGTLQARLPWEYSIE